MRRFLAWPLLRRRLPLLAAALCLAAALVKLWPPGRDFETVAVPNLQSATPDSPGARLDAVLLEHLPHLGYIRYFDRALGAGPTALTLRQPLWMDRCEVSQGDFRKFAAWAPLHPHLAAPAPGQPPDWRHASATRNHALSGRLDAPANGVAWFDAAAYCRAAGGRLPTAAEWTAAAAGKRGRLFPWGDTFQSAGWPHLDPLLNATLGCDATPAADTAGGLAGMGHGVSEWAVADNAAPVAMGGNAFDSPRELHSLTMLYRPLPAHARSPYLGFRCVYPAPQLETRWRSSPAVVALAPGEYPVGVPATARVPKLAALLPPERRALIGRLFEASAQRGNAGEVQFTEREITRAEYAAFLDDPFVAAGFHAERNQPRRHSHRPPDWERQLRQPQLPVVNVDWWAAYAFASWAGGRLPTAEEWESAASGQGQRWYPWGDSFAAAQPVTGERALGGPTLSSPADGDETPEGLLALGGNVSEWTGSVSAAAGAYAVVVKGGNYLLPGVQTARWDYRNHVSPHHRAPTLGFRVAFDRSRSANQAN